MKTHEFVLKFIAQSLLSLLLTIFKINRTEQKHRIRDSDSL